MNGRDVSTSYSDVTHNSTIDFSEFVEVYENEKRIEAENAQPTIDEQGI